MLLLHILHSFYFSCFFGMIIYFLIFGFILKVNKCILWGFFFIKFKFTNYEY